MSVWIAPSLEAMYARSCLSTLERADWRRLADVEGDCLATVNMSVHVLYLSFDYLPAPKRLLYLTIDSLASGSEPTHLNSMALCRPLLERIYTRDL